MGTLGILNILAWLLELCVPSYALRLVRRFGAHQVGSFVVIAFISLAVLHLFNPVKAAAAAGWGLTVVYAIASVLLLIGMGHVETLCHQRERTQLEEKELRAKLESDARQRADGLVKINQEMAQELVRFQQQVETLTASERQFRMLFAQHPHPMWVFDLRSGRILAGNEAALNLYGFSQREFTALFAKDLLSREALPGFSADAAKPCCSVESRGIWRHRRKDRTPMDVGVMAVDLRFGGCPARLVFAEDMGPRVSRELEIREAERMRVLGRVGAGVAHHFGQILTVVEEQVRALGQGEETTTEAEPLQQILSETRRGSALLRQLLAVGACEGVQPEPVDVNLFIREKEGLLRRVVGERIALELDLGEGLAPVLVDPRVLDQILVNLVLNARDALPQGGSIGIYTGAAWIEPSQPRNARSNVSPGHFVHVKVRDDGCGMPHEIQEHLFEPFFTTRDESQAMGLGLATIYGAVRQHGGSIEFVSEPGNGSEFSFYLPAAQPSTGTDLSQQSAMPVPDRGTVLLVEANDRVRDLTRHILEKNGYHVIEADTPTTAGVLMETQAGKIQLLLTDLSFPNGSSGRDLALQLCQVNQNLKVIYVAGPLSPEDNEAALLQEANLLRKPYTADQLLQTLSADLVNGSAQEA